MLTLKVAFEVSHVGATQSRAPAGIVDRRIGVSDAACRLMERHVKGGNFGTVFR
jgi:hypothetical protein